MAGIKRRKAQAERKEETIKFLVTTDEKRQFEQAAKEAGEENLSSWLRRLARKAISGG